MIFQVCKIVRQVNSELYQDKVALWLDQKHLI